MASAAAQTAVAAEGQKAPPAAAAEVKPPQLPAPEAIDEDDEFEEFKEECEWRCVCRFRPPAPFARVHSPSHTSSFSTFAAWDDKSKLAPAEEEWADDWDDEDTDTAFDKVLRAELAKAAQQKPQ